MKIIKGIANFFKRILTGIVNIIDKIIITPISRLVYFIVDKLGMNSGLIEKILNKKNSLIIISLIFAFATFFIIDSKALRLVEKEALVLSNQSVEVIYNEEAYVVEGVPDKVDVTLMGRKSDLYLANQLGEHNISLDLSGLKAGTHKVKLKYNNPIQTLEYKLDPSTITVVISPKVSDTKSITTDIINTDKLKETLIISDVTLDRDEVIIKSSKEKLDKVASVKALVDVGSLEATTAGNYEVEKVKLVAYDEDGKELKDIEIVPSKVSANITITSPNKEVTVKVVPVGEVKAGSAIKSITTDVTKVKIYGEESALEDIEFLPVEIDVNNLTKDRNYKVALKKPSGIKAISTKTITVSVKIETQSSKDFTGIQVEIENLDKNLVAGAASNDDRIVDVTVKGVSTVLDNLDKKDIKAYVDLTNYNVGTWDVPVKVTGTDLKLSYSSKIKTVKIIIEKK